MIIDKSRQEIVTGRYGMGVAGEMEIDVFHRDHLRMASASSTSLESKHGSQGRLSKRHHGAVPEPTQPHREPNGCRCFSLSQRGWVDCGNQDIPAFGLPLKPIQCSEGDLPFVSSVREQFIRRQAELLANFLNRKRLTRSGDFEVRHS